jgi:hypothetical protein
MIRSVLSGLKPALISFALAAPIAQAQSSIPANLSPEGETSRFVYAAIGVQIYECRVTDGKAAWAFVAPEADLFDSNGKRVGKHYAGPHWESDDGSKLVGAVKARADSTRSGAIPHLLLTAKADAKPGVLAGITHIQRLNTLGGVAPSTPCTVQDAGKQARVYYTADYRFLAK